MPGDLQAKLLRLLETGQFFKVGNTVPAEANVRIISATNRHLPSEVDEGKFRRDLFYRLNLFTIEIPPLRDRKKDIPILANHYVKVFAEKMNKSQPVINNELLRLLENQIWKGNIRELKNVIERAMILSDAPELGPESLPFEFRQPTPSSPRLSVFELASVEKQHILQVLNYMRGNKVEAARLLEITDLFQLIRFVFQKFPEPLPQFPVPDDHLFCVRRDRRPAAVFAPDTRYDKRADPHSIDAVDYLPGLFI